MRQLSGLLHISCIDWISLCHKGSSSSTHSCRWTCLQQCWHMWICLWKFLGSTDVCVLCAMPVKGQQNQKRLTLVMCALRGSGHLLPRFPIGPRITEPHSSNHQLLQFVVQAKFKPFNFFAFLYCSGCYPVSSSDFNNILYECSRLFSHDGCAPLVLFVCWLGYGSLSRVKEMFLISSPNTSSP